MEERPTKPTSKCARIKKPVSVIIPSQKEVQCSNPETNYDSNDHQKYINK